MSVGSDTSLTVVSAFSGSPSGTMTVTNQLLQVNNSSGNPALFISQGGAVGFGTVNPAVEADVAGALAIRRGDVTLTAGNNNDIALGGATFVKLSGPSAAFAVTGFAGGSDGRLLYLYNATSQAMTIRNNNTGSAAANRILTLTGADVTLRAGAQSFASFIYDAAQNLWVLAATN